MEFKDEMSDERTHMPELKQTDKFKLMKMSKGYQWEISVNTDDVLIMTEKVELLNNWAVNHFGESSITKEVADDRI